MAPRRWGDSRPRFPEVTRTDTACGGADRRGMTFTTPQWLAAFSWRADRKVAGIVAAAVVGAGLLRTGLALTERPLDFLVYRQAGQDVLDGLSPYRDTGGLPFTYPPVAAYLARVLALLPEGLGAAALTVANLAAYALVVVLVARRLGMPRAHLFVWLGGGIALAPQARHLSLGQVNLLLMGLVVVDLLALPTRGRGVLIGLAAAVKVVPGVFVLLLLIRGERAAAARALGVAALLTGLTALVDRDASALYFGRLPWDPVRVGGVTYPDNQSLVGVLARILATNTPPTWATLPVQVLALALGSVAARRAQAAQDHVGALVCLALGALLASPVSWSHHWVWVVPAGMWLWVRAQHALTAALVAPALVGPLTLAEAVHPWPWTGMPWPWPPWGQLACALLPLGALAVLVARLRSEDGSEAGGILGHLLGRVVGDPRPEETPQAVALGARDDV